VPFFDDRSRTKSHACSSRSEVFCRSMM
jgi:hypothetical protein